MSVFDADSFLNTSVEQANETKYTPVPEGEYLAVIRSVAARVVNTKNGPSQMMDVTFDIDKPDLAAELNRENLTVRYSMFLDINEKGGLDFGTNKNVKLGKLRAAAGQNQPGVPWTPRNLEGAGPMLIVVKHRSDDNDPTVVYDEVARVAPAN